MKKRIFGVLFFLLFVVFAGSCTEKSEQEIFYDTQKKLNNIDSYYCEVEIISIGNKEPQKYIMKQWFQKPDKYKLEIVKPDELKGKTTIFDGNRAWIYHPAIEQTWIMKNFINYEEQNMFLGYFIRNSLESETVEISSKEIDGEKHLIITTSIPGNHAYFNKKILYFNTKTMNPYLLLVYDVKEQLRIEVRYRNFEYNPKLGDELFQINTG